MRRTVRRNVRYLIEFRAVRSSLGIQSSTVRSLLGECQLFDRVSGCKENVRRNVRYLIELRVVRKFVRRIRGIR